jgi:hypothetical protein
MGITDTKRSPRVPLLQSRRILILSEGLLSMTSKLHDALSAEIGFENSH